MKYAAFPVLVMSSVSILIGITLFLLKNQVKILRFLIFQEYWKFVYECN